MHDTTLLAAFLMKRIGIGRPLAGAVALAVKAYCEERFEAISGRDDRLVAIFREDRVMQAQLRFNLTDMQARLLIALLGRDVCHKEYLYMTLYGADRWPVDSKIVDVVICKLRKLVPALQVKTIWGRGYQVLNRKELLKEIENAVV